MKYLNTLLRVSYIIYIGIRDFILFEIRKNLDLRKILVTPKIFLKSRFHCIMTGVIIMSKADNNDGS